ncbi:MAG: conjugal transfer protein TraD [Legionella sp.]|nr:conjugal transfer protein TraD [Legionella sp.]
MESSVFVKLLDEVKAFLDEDVDREYQIYAIGKSFLELKKNKEEFLETLKKILGADWKNLRFRNLVRLGADIENAGLSTLSRATLVGALLYYQRNNIKVPDLVT